MSPRCLRCKAGSEWIEGSPLDAHANVLLLRAEVRALRRERRALRKALRNLATESMSACDEIGCQNVEAGECFDRDGNRCAMCDLAVAQAAAEDALKPRKARRRKA